MKRYINLALVLILCLSLLNITAFAAGESASLTGPGSVRAGDTVAVTLNVTGNNVYGVSGILSYNGAQLTLVSSKATAGTAWVIEFNDNHFVAYDNNLSSPVKGTAALLTLTFKVGDVEPGTAITVSCDNLVLSDGDSDAKIGAVSYNTKVEAPASTDNSLKTLAVNNAAISPAFDPKVTTYTAYVPFATYRLDVSATPADEATAAINSPYLTPGGTTKVTVTVTAENGESKVYTINVFRAQDPNYVESSNNNLSSIKVQGYVLSPVFSEKVTEYVVWLPYETESVTVSANPADYKASVRIEGGKNLTAGQDNEIKVICTAEDGTEKVYTVIAKRAAAHGSTEPTVPPTEPTEPSAAPTEPSTIPTTPPTTAPTTPPTEPVQPGEQEQGGGIRTWVLIVACIVFLLLGAFAGIIIDKKLLKKTSTADR